MKFKLFCEIGEGELVLRGTNQVSILVNGQEIGYMEVGLGLIHFHPRGDYKVEDVVTHGSDCAHINLERV